MLSQLQSAKVDVLILINPLKIGSLCFSAVAIISYWMDAELLERSGHNT